MQQTDPLRQAQPHDAGLTCPGKENGPAQGSATVLGDTTASVLAETEPVAPVTPEPVICRPDPEMPGPRVRSNQPVLVHATGPKTSGSCAAAPGKPFMKTRTTAPPTAVQHCSSLAVQTADVPVQPSIDTDIAKGSAELLDGLLRLTSPQSA